MSGPAVRPDSDFSQAAVRQIACHNPAEPAEITETGGRIAYSLRVLDALGFSNLTRSIKFLKDLQKQSGQNGFLESEWSPKMDAST
jgi:hypothetical protein